MPLKTMTGTQKTLTRAFVGWLPAFGNITNDMRHDMRTGGENEYFFTEKGMYFQDKDAMIMPHLPYFSNCRGFGRATPMWNLLEQGQSCVWDPEPTEVSIFSLGVDAKGDRESIEVVLTRDIQQTRA